MGRRDRRRGRTPKQPRRRVPRDWERPGVVLKGPPITLTCECGQRRELAYGERWQCESCGRSWDTTRIPAEQYDRIRKLSLRYRAIPVIFGLFITAVGIFFTFTGNVFSVFFLLPIGLISWFVFLRPWHRKRYRAAIKGLPRWELRAD
jgi:hypothetical protein